MKYFNISLAAVISLPAATLASGSSIRGGADYCDQLKSEYNCMVTKNLDDGTQIEKHYKINGSNNDQVFGDGRFELNLCPQLNEKGEKVLWVSLRVYSEQDSSGSALSTTVLSPSQKTFNLIASVLKNSPDGSLAEANAYRVDCKK